MFGLEFKDPAYLWLMVPLAGLGAFYIWRKLYDREPAIAVSSTKLVQGASSFRSLVYRWLPVLRFISLFLLVIALARPGRGVEYTSIKNPGIDIMIVLDVSDSMMGEDFQPRNRLEVARQVIRDFVGRRGTDRVGLVVFSGDAYLQCPLTAERSMISDILDDIDFDTVGEEGTAIGDALALAASRMAEGAAKSKIILLLTDGVNNRGSIDPGTAASMCAELGIRIYSIGIGKEGLVPYSSGRGIFSRRTLRQDQFDPAAIQRLSETTGGKFYRATSSGVMWENIRDIDRLERSEITSRVYHEFSDRFMVFIIIAVSVFFAEIFLRSVVFRKVP